MNILFSLLFNVYVWMITAVIIGVVYSKIKYGEWFHEKKM